MSTVKLGNLTFDSPKYLVSSWYPVSMKMTVEGSICVSSWGFRFQALGVFSSLVYLLAELEKGSRPQRTSQP